MLRWAIASASSEMTNHPQMVMYLSFKEAGTTLQKFRCRSSVKDYFFGIWDRSALWLFS